MRTVNPTDGSDRIGERHPFRGYVICGTPCPKYGGPTLYPCYNQASYPDGRCRHHTTERRTIRALDERAAERAVRRVSAVTKVEVYEMRLRDVVAMRVVARALCEHGA